MPVKPLSEEQKQDAARLKAAFKTFKAKRIEAGLSDSQDEIAAELPFGQSAMNQYLNGRIPLNGPALLEFSRLFGVPPESISSSIVKAERIWAENWIASPLSAQEPSAIYRLGGVHWPFPKVDLGKVKGLSDMQLVSLETALLLSAMHLGLDIAAGPAEQSAVA